MSEMEPGRRDALLAFRQVRTEILIIKCSVPLTRFANRKRENTSNYQIIFELVCPKSIRAMICSLMLVVLEREALVALEKTYTKTEDDLKAVQSVGQIVAEILKQLDDERCWSSYLHNSVGTTGLI
jgi:hypothetical protein